MGKKTATARASTEYSLMWYLNPRRRSILWCCRNCSLTKKRIRNLRLLTTVRKMQRVGEQLQSHNHADQTYDTTKKNYNYTFTIYTFTRTTGTALHTSRQAVHEYAYTHVTHIHLSVRASVLSVGSSAWDLYTRVGWLVGSEPRRDDIIYKIYFYVNSHFHHIHFPNISLHTTAACWRCIAGHLNDQTAQTP